METSDTEAQEETPTLTSSIRNLDDVATFIEETGSMIYSESMITEKSELEKKFDEADSFLLEQQEETQSQMQEISSRIAEVQRGAWITFNLMDLDINGVFIFIAYFFTTASTTIFGWLSKEDGAYNYDLNFAFFLVYSMTAIFSGIYLYLYNGSDSQLSTLFPRHIPRIGLSAFFNTCGSFLGIFMYQYVTIEFGNALKSSKVIFSFALFPLLNCKCKQSNRSRIMMLIIVALVLTMMGYCCDKIDAENTLGTILALLSPLCSVFRDLVHDIKCFPSPDELNDAEEVFINCVVSCPLALSIMFVFQYYETSTFTLQKCFNLNWFAIGFIVSSIIMMPAVILILKKHGSLVKAIVAQFSIVVVILISYFPFMDSSDADARNFFYIVTIGILGLLIKEGMTVTKKVLNLEKQQEEYVKENENIKTILTEFQTLHETYRTTYEDATDKLTKMKDMANMR